MKHTASSSSTSDRSTDSKAKSKSLKPSPGALGAIVGAVVGGVVGLALVKKRRSLKKPLTTTLPKAGKAALSAVKGVAKDALEVTKASALKAGDEALTQIKADAAKMVTEAVSDQATPAQADSSAKKSAKAPGTKRHGSNGSANSASASASARGTKKRASTGNKKAARPSKTARKTKASARPASSAKA